MNQLELMIRYKIFISTAVFVLAIFFLPLQIHCLLSSSLLCALGACECVLFWCSCPLASGLVWPMGASARAERREEREVRYLLPCGFPEGSPWAGCFPLPKVVTSIRYLPPQDSILLPLITAPSPHFLA